MIDDADNCLQLDEVLIGFSTRQKHVLDKMDMPCSFWQQAVWIDFFNKGSSKWSHVEYFLNTFSNVLPNDDEKSDHLYEEFTHYKGISISKLPDTDLTDAPIASYEDHDE